MFPKKKPNLLSELEIEEISLVDSPANAQVVNGRKVSRARVALLKRDNQPYMDRNQLQEHMDRLEARRRITKGENQMSDLEDVLKANPTREAIAAAVVKRAVKIAKEEHISLSAAEDLVWCEKESAAAQAYDAISPDKSARRSEPTTARITNSEIALDELARLEGKRARKAGATKSYAQCLKSVLDTEEGMKLMESYDREMAAGQTREIPESALIRPESERSFQKLEKRAKDDPGSNDDDSNGNGVTGCSKCGAKSDPGDRFCSKCGSSLTVKRR